VWARDFRLGGEDVSQLTALLVGTAKEQGMTLDRIMFNGVEAWALRYNA
jgi:hypothetical protein